MQDTKAPENRQKITRARAIILHHGQALMMKRCKPHIQYYALLGGKVEPGETPEQACVREVLEECGVNVRLIREVHRDTDIFEGIENTHFLYLCEYMDGTPQLGGEEVLRNCAENSYEPMWIDTAEIAKLNIKPDWQAPVILRLIEENQ